MAAPPPTQLSSPRPSPPLPSPPSPPSSPLLRRPLPTITPSLPSKKPSFANRTHKPPPLHDDVVSWTASIARHARKGLLSAAASTFSSMLSAGVPPNLITLATLLSACADFSSSPSSLPLGLCIHAHALKFSPGDAEPDVVLGTALVDMYAKCGRAELARHVFDRMPVRNSITFNALIDGYARRGEVERALSLLRAMPNRDRVSWTALINGCIKNGLLDDALQHFRAMQGDHIDPDYVTIIAVLTVCAELGALGHGLWAHRFAMTRSFLKNVRLSNSLIDMYARCGRVDLAFQVFDSMPSRTLVSWNSMIVGFAINSCSTKALEHFSKMQEAGFKPNGISFTGALTACSHAGLVNEGLHYFDDMQSIYKISPSLEHYGCIIDLLARAGRLEDALRMLENMPMKPNEPMLGSLLAACRAQHSCHLSLAEKLMDYLVELEPESDSSFVLLSNIYAAVGRWEGVGQVRNVMKAMGVKRRPGFSAVEVDSHVHEFVAGDRAHPQVDDIFGMLDLLGFEMGLYGYHLEDNLGLSLELDYRS